MQACWNIKPLFPYKDMDVEIMKLEDCRNFSIFILFLLFILEGFFNFCFHFVFLLHGCSRRFKARGKREISQPHNLEYPGLQWLLHWELVALTQGEVGLASWQRNRGFVCNSNALL